MRLWSKERLPLTVLRALGGWVVCRRLLDKEARTALEEAVRDVSSKAGEVLSALESLNSKGQDFDIASRRAALEAQWGKIGF